jgi:hypothetical protein
VLLTEPRGLLHAFPFAVAAINNEGSPAAKARDHTSVHDRQHGHLGPGEVNSGGPKQDAELGHFTLPKSRRGKFEPCLTNLL